MLNVSLRSSYEHHTSATSSLELLNQATPLTFSTCPSRQMMVERHSAAHVLHCCVQGFRCSAALRSHFDPSESNRLCCRAAADNQVVGVLLAQHLSSKPGSAAQLHQLRRFVQAPQASFSIVLQRPWQAADNPVYDVIDKSQTLASQLAGRCILEFPVFVVMLPEDVPVYMPGAEASAT